jgi:hypothetical protein
LLTTTFNHEAENSGIDNISKFYWRRRETAVEGRECAVTVVTLEGMVKADKGVSFSDVWRKKIEACCRRYVTIA